MRVSKADGSQTTDLQRDALLAVGIAPDSLYEDPASREAARRVNNELALQRSKLLADFLDKGLDVLPTEWSEASLIATLHTHLTVEQLSTPRRQFAGQALG